MPRRSDAKEQMVAAARRLFKENGYAGTSFVDVLQASSAPRGSIYFHFPGGKEQLAQEVIFEHSAATAVRINRAAIAASTPAEFITSFMTTAREDMVQANYLEGCAIAPVVMERAAATDTLRGVAKAAFQDMINACTARFLELGLPEAQARSLGTATVAALQGCLIVARATGDTACFDTAAQMLVASARSVSKSS